MSASMNWEEDLKNAVINTAASGDIVLIAAPPTGSYLAIDFIQIVPTSAATITFMSGTVAEGQTALTGPYPLSQQQVVTDENTMENVKGVLTCANARSFVINNATAVQLGGFVRYRIVGNN